MVDYNRNMLWLQNIFVVIWIYNWGGDGLVIAYHKSFLVESAIDGNLESGGYSYIEPGFSRREDVFTFNLLHRDILYFQCDLES
jgi:hypothetical protein